MKKAVLPGDRRATLVDVPDPQPKDDWVVVKVEAAPMCAEYKSFVAGDKVDFLGHEAAGEVVAVAQPGRVREGGRPRGRDAALCVRQVRTVYQRQLYPLRTRP